MNLLQEKIVVLASAACLSIILVLSLSLLMEQPIYTTTTSLTTYYYKPAYPPGYVSASFNDSNGNGLAGFTLNFVHTNQSVGPVWLTVQFNPEWGVTSLDSLKLTFSTNGSQYWTNVAVMVPPFSEGIVPSTLGRGDLNQEMIAYNNLGLQGTGSNMCNFWFYLVGVQGSSNSNYGVTLTVDVTAHTSQTSLVKHSYSGEALFQIVVQPNGIISV